MTDRGRTYITFGPPAEIESHPSALGGRPAYEIWLYRPVSGVSGFQSFTFADVGNNGEYKLQTPWASSDTPVFNRLVRWTVTDPLGRFVTSLTQEHFHVRENGASKSLTYFEGSQSPAAIAVCSASHIPELDNSPVPGLVQTRSLDIAVRHVSSQLPMRKVAVNAGCSQHAPIPGGIFVVAAESAAGSQNGH